MHTVQVLATLVVVEALAQELRELWFLLAAQEVAVKHVLLVEAEVLQGMLVTVVVVQLQAALLPQALAAVVVVVAY
jgi:hypothetical protein